MSHNVMIQITTSIRPGTKIKTPSGRSEFEFYHLDPRGVILRIGKKGNFLSVPAQCFEDIPRFLRGKGWVKIGAVHSESSEDTLDNFIKQYTHGTSAASYVAPILEKAQVIEIDRKKPAKIRLIR